MALKSGDVVITNISPTVGFSDRGEVIRMTNVEFTVRGKGPFSRQMPTDAFSAAEIIAQITAYAEEIVRVLDFTGGEQS